LRREPPRSDIAIEISRNLPAQGVTLAAMTKRPLLRIAGAALIALASTSPVGPPPDPTPLVVEPSGCFAVLAGGACERPVDGKLRVWVDAPGPVRVRIDGREVASAEVTSSSHGGTRLTLDARTGDRLELEANGRRGVLVLAPPFEPPWAKEAAAARARGDYARVRALARPRTLDADAAVRGRALGLLGRAELATGNVSSAVDLLGRSSAEGVAAGRLSEAVDDGLARSFALSQRAGRWTEAGAELDRLEPISRGYADGRARVPYYRALVASALGDLRRAMQELGVARERAERLGNARLVWNVRNEWALSLARFGHRAEALDELVSLAENDDATIPACDRATALFNAGFGTLVRSQEQAGPCTARAPAGDAARWLHASLALNDARCPDASRTAMGHVLLGDVALEAGDLAQATQELSQVSLREASVPLRRDATDLAARIALARGDAEGALAKYERLVALARATGRVDDERRALEGVGHAHERIGAIEPAITAFTAAEELLIAASILVPIGEAGAYQRTRETASRARVELLLGRGRTAEALAVARTARVRLLSSVASIDRIAALPREAHARWVAAVDRYRAERRLLDAAGAHDWELATSELVRAQREREGGLARLHAALDEAMVALPRASIELPPFTVGAGASLFAMTLREGAVVFVGDARGLRAARIDLAAATAEPRTELARAIVAAASPEIARATSLRVMTSADLACADVHAQPLGDGRPLAVTKRVIYGLDLARGGEPPARARRALVVSDTRDDLPLARDEGALVAASLEGTSGVVHLSGARATGDAVHEQLATATIFHFAGHASNAQGDLFLPLAGGARLTTSDVLALPMSPERVILSACEAGRIQPSGLAVGMGFVQGFLERGASEVLAPTRPVKDDLALALARAVVASERADLASALATLAAAPGALDWSAYRIWGR
jgi:tetratricopeptide (TPR) repeat protein